MFVPVALVVAALVWQSQVAEALLIRAGRHTSVCTT
jgi:hypothetical protein